MPDKRPNVLVFVTHDTGRHLGCYGIDEVHSPNIDRLAEEGVRFGRFFNTSPMCSPSRAAMFSGLHPQTNGVMGLVHSPWYWKYKDGVKHISHHFREGGYRTVSAGVIHEAYHPAEDLGFEEHLLGNQASDVVGSALPKLRELAGGDKPFYFQMGTFQTHSPYLVDGVEPDDEKGIYIPPQYQDNDEARRQFAELQGSIRHVDARFGEVMATLEELGLKENTIVVYTVDHGIAFPRAKGTLYDAGTGTALIVRWPGGGIGGGGVRDQLLSNIDLTPTLLDLAGVGVPEGLQGVSFAPACTDADAPGRTAVFGEHTMPSVNPDTRCVRTDRWKLIRTFFPCRKYPEIPIDLNGPGKTGGGPQNETPVVQLYDLQADPLETQDLAADPVHAETVAELSALLLQHMRDVGDSMLDGPVAWPYYDKAMADLYAAAEESE